MDKKRLEERLKKIDKALEAYTTLWKLGLISDWEFWDKQYRLMMERMYTEKALKKLGDEE